MNALPGCIASGCPTEACALPAFGDGSHATWGIVCLICVPFVLISPAWWANPLFFAGMHRTWAAGNNLSSPSMFGAGRHGAWRRASG